MKNADGCGSIEGQAEKNLGQFARGHGLVEYLILEGQAEMNRGQFARGHGLDGYLITEGQAEKNRGQFARGHGLVEGLRQMAKGHVHGCGWVGDYGAGEHMQHGRDLVD